MDQLINLTFSYHCEELPIDILWVAVGIKRHNERGGHLVNVNWNGMSAGRGWESLSNTFPNVIRNILPTPK